MVNKSPWIFRNAMFPRVYTEKALFYLLGTKKSEFAELTRDKSLFYKIDKEPKKSGGFRDIYKPEWRLKSLLRKLNNRVLSRLNFPSFVHCGPSGRSIVSAARGHSKFKIHLSLDIKSFFDNVSEAVTASTLKKIGVRKEIVQVIIKAGVEDNKLPQGFPTSPLLATLVISYLLQDFYGSFDKDKILLSVYADDILLSSDDEKLLWDAKKYIEKNLKTVALNLNSKECLAQNGEQFTWLSLQVYPWVTLPRRAQLELEKRVYEYKAHGIIPADFVPKKPLKKDQSLTSAWEESLKGRAVFFKSVSANRITSKVLTRLESSKN